MRWQDLIGTVSNTLRIGLGKSTLDASAITAPRTHNLPNQSGTIALLSDISGGSGLSFAQVFAAQQMRI